MGLASSIGHISLSHKGEVHGTAVQIVLWQTHGHHHLKGTIVTSSGLAFVDDFLFQGIAEIAALPIPGVAEPPIGHLTTNGILHFGILNGYTSIAHSLTLCTNGVASLIRLLVFRELHLECWTFVLLDADAGRTIIDTYCKTSVQQTLGQRELCGTLTKTVSGQLLLRHQFVVGITQLGSDALALNSHIVQSRLLLPNNS